ncbi:MAG TPA: hypothetical protein VGT79_02970, partial [Xanthomonadaceae bacterium]|nr:hypothetical protein [Xanthomonadaceae bacterium]
NCIHSSVSSETFFLTSGRFFSMCIPFALSTGTFDVMCTKNFSSSKNSWPISKKTCMTTSQTAMNTIRPATNTLFSFVTSVFSLPKRISRVGSVSPGRAYTFASLACRRVASRCFSDSGAFATCILKDAG